MVFNSFLKHVKIIEDEIIKKQNKVRENRKLSAEQKKAKLAKIVEKNAKFQSSWRMIIIPIKSFKLIIYFYIVKMSYDKIYFPYPSTDTTKSSLILPQIQLKGKKVRFGEKSYDHFTEGHLDEERKER